MPVRAPNVPRASHVAKNPQFEAKHHRGGHGRFGAGMSKPKLLVRDRKAIAAIGQAFSSRPIPHQAAAHAFTGAHGRRIRPETVGAFHDLAKALRSGKTDDERIAKLDAAMQPTEHDLVLIRHVGPEAFGLKASDLAGLRELLADRKIVDKAYTPAALHQEPGQGGITLHIAVPKGTRALVAGDNEMWLDRELELAVSDVRPNDHGGYDVELTVLPKGGQATPRKAAKKAAAPTLPPAPAKRATKKAAMPAKKTTRPAKPKAPRASEPPKASKPTAKHLLDTSKAVAGAGVGARSAVEVDLAKRGNEIYGGTFGGIEAAVTTADIHADGTIVLRGVLGTGEYKGKFSRIIGADEDGDAFAYHDLLVVAASAQGQGFAEEFNANAEQWYREAGIGRIELQANIDIGGYAWARAGYDFANENERASRIRELGARVQQYEWKASQAPNEEARSAVEFEINAAKALIARAEAGERISAYEISQVGRPPGATGKNAMWIGKLMLIGSNWQAVKWL